MFLIHFFLCSVHKLTDKFESAVTAREKTTRVVNVKFSSQCFDAPQSVGIFPDRIGVEQSIVDGRRKFKCVAGKNDFLNSSPGFDAFATFAARAACFFRLPPVFLTRFPIGSRFFYLIVFSCRCFPLDACEVSFA